MKALLIISSIIIALTVFSIGFITLSLKNDNYEWGTFNIGGGGFVSGIVAGKREMYLRTDVGGAYKYDYNNKKWVQLFDFINEEKRGFLSIKGIAIDPTDDDIVYFLCGCAYFTEAKTAIYKTTNGGRTFQEIDVSNLIRAHGNGDGRQCIEPIAIDPDNPKVIYVGGDVAYGESALIKSVDGGQNWEPVKSYDSLNFFKYELKYPSWEETVVRGTLEADYYQQNGISSIKIINKKIYVGTSVKGQANIHVADIDKEEFKVLSDKLPTENFPLSITDDSNGNLFITYIKGLAFDGEKGGAYKYNIETGEVTDISPIESSIGMISADKNDPKKLVARTCGIWRAQWWGQNDQEGVTWGDLFFKSNDGGSTWINITPGQQEKTNDDKTYFLSNPLSNNGYKWITNKAIHWGAAIIFDPRNENKIITLSGNGIFACDNVWDEKEIQFYFDPKGEEEVVPLDLVSIKGGPVYSAIGDYDGFIHEDIEEIPTQYEPNMGSTNIIAVCHENPKIMMRVAAWEEKAFYSIDGGKTWTQMKGAGGEGGGRGAITPIEDNKYRLFHTVSNGIKYSDDYGDTWKDCEGLEGSGFGVLVDESDPTIVYSYSNKAKSDQNPKAQNIFGISKDSGIKFTTQVVSEDEEHSERIAYLGKGKLVLAAGKGGAYTVSNFGEKIEKLENVNYCKTIGYGIMEKNEEDYTLYMYGKPKSTSKEGIYRSQDSGKTWVLINSDKLYGGTGNGNFLVGDMNTFGTVYMSSVGCGIIYGRLKQK